jgi:hypothetical protein
VLKKRNPNSRAHEHEYMPGHTGGNPTSSHSFGGRIWKAVLLSPGTWTTFRRSSAVRIANFRIAHDPGAIGRLGIQQPTLRAISQLYNCRD